MAKRPQSDYFNDDEFQCQCGRCGKGINQMQDSTLRKLFNAREEAGTAFVITSAFRCPEHNRKVGGTSNSAHLRGHAVDIAATSSRQYFKILKALFAAGFTRIGYNRASKFIHADDDPTLPQEVFFDY